MPDKNQLNIIHRYLTGEADPKEKAWLQHWINKDPVNLRKFEEIKRIWEVDPKQEVHTDLKKAWNQLEELIEKRERKECRSKDRILAFRRRTGRKSGRETGSIWLRVAAILVIGVLLSIYATSFITGGEDVVNRTAEHAEMVMQEIKTDRAHQSEVTFTDGTVVRLNAASLIRFPEQFDSDVREVYLEGEAWFDVHHNPNVEFIVQTRDATVRVLGTEFNVKAHSEDPEVEVVVADGTVSVQGSTDVSGNSETEVLLSKGEMSRVQRGEAPSPAQPVDTGKYLSWLRGDFVFEETPLSRVLNEWERRFDIDFEVEDETLLSTPFTGEFRNESIDEMLRLTSISLGFTYERENNRITINN